MSAHELDCHASARPPAEVCMHVLLMSMCMFCCLCVFVCVVVRPHRSDYGAAGESPT